MLRKASLVGLMTLAALARAALGGADTAKSQAQQDLHCQVVSTVGSAVPKGLILAHVPGPTGWVLVAAAETDRTGECDLTLPGGECGPWLLEVAAEGYHDKTVVSVLEPDQVVPWQTIALEGARVLVGRVVGGPDKPIPGAQVTLESPQGTGQTETDREGRFGFKNLLPTRVRLRVVVPGYGGGTYLVDLSDQVDPLEIVLLPQRQVRLQVVDELSKPVPGVRVQVQVPEQTDSVTDAEGMISIGGVGSGPGRLLVGLVDRFYAFERPAIWLPVPAGTEPALVTAKAKHGGQISGQVVEAGSDLPIPAATVWITQAAPAAAAKGNTEGMFELNAVTKGTYVVAATHPSHAARAALVKVTPGKTAQITLSLTPGATVAGVVVDAAGKPVSPAVVRATLWWPKDFPDAAKDALLPINLPWRAVRTDAEGRFRLARLPAGRLELQALSYQTPATAKMIVNLAPEEQLSDVKLVLPSN